MVPLGVSSDLLMDAQPLGRWLDVSAKNHWPPVWPSSLVQSACEYPTIGCLESAMAWVCSAQVLGMK